MNTKYHGSLYSPIYTHAVWLALLILGFWFRLWELPIQLLADDEWHALNKLLQSDAWGIYTSFGNADHSIPLTLYYHATSFLTPLSENIMRFPLVIAGLLTLVLVPLMLRSWLSSPELLLMTVLIALSPIFIYYTRMARPYALSTLLVFISLFAFYSYAQRPGWRNVTAYLTCATVSAWLQPVTLTFLLTPFIFFGAKAIGCVYKKKDAAFLKSLVLLAAGLLCLLLVVLGPPLYYSLSDIAGKTGVNYPTFLSLINTFKLLSGSQYSWFLFSYLIFLIIGAVSLWERERQLLIYLLLCTLLPFLAISSSGAAWIQHPLVTARYLLPILLVMSMFVAIGFYRIVMLFSSSTVVATSYAVILSVFVYSAGPLRNQYNSQINQFTGHMAYQFDYDWHGNTYNESLDNRPVSDFYLTLGQAPPGTLHLIVAPWHMEWHWNRWYLDQRIHQQTVTAGFLAGLCGEDFYGEYAQDTERVDLINIVHINDINRSGAGKLGKFDYLIYHKKASRPDQDASQYFNCLQAIRDVFGEPLYEDDELIAYHLHEAGA